MQTVHLDLKGRKDIGPELSSAVSPKCGEILNSCHKPPLDKYWRL